MSAPFGPEGQPWRAGRKRCRRTRPSTAQQFTSRTSAHHAPTCQCFPALRYQAGTGPAGSRPGGPGCAVHRRADHESVSHGPRVSAWLRSGDDRHRSAANAAASATLRALRLEAARAHSDLPGTLTPIRSGV